MLLYRSTTALDFTGGLPLPSAGQNFIVIPYESSQLRIFDIHGVALYFVPERMPLDGIPCSDAPPRTTFECLYEKEHFRESVI